MNLITAENRRINEENIRLFRTNYSSSTYHCIGCHKAVLLDDTYSNKGNRLICWACGHKYARQENMEFYDFLKKYIWEDKE